jgi:hypothetical protein
VISTQLRDHLQTLSFLVRPRALLGDYVASPSKEPARNADAAFAEFKTLYESILPTRPFGFRKEIVTPMVNLSHVPEITPWEYTHSAHSDRGEKSIAITSPLRWVLHFAPYPPRRVMELVSNRENAADELLQAAIHYLVMHVAIVKQPPVLRLFEALRLPVESARLPGLGDLPITVISSAVRTVLPPDPIVVESTEISGRDAFEEIVDRQQLQELADPLKCKLQDLLSAEAELR